MHGCLGTNVRLYRKIPRSAFARHLYAFHLCTPYHLCLHVAHRALGLREYLGKNKPSLDRKLTKEEIITQLQQHCGPSPDTGPLIQRLKVR